MIPNIVLKNLTRKALSVESISNACICLVYYPKTLKHAEVIVLHKPNKSTSPSSYRPISLLLSTSKLLEIITQKRVVKYLDSSNIIPSNQFGFRPKHFTTHQYYASVKPSIEGLKGTLHSTTAFLDVAQAFEKVWLD